MMLLSSRCSVEIAGLEFEDRSFHCNRLDGGLLRALTNLSFRFVHEFNLIVLIEHASRFQEPVDVIFDVAGT